ncbi:hypothetical protein HU675_0033945 [Bradyrhizobium septentrionale]|uniref:hypothetical protein n=1 Tax=Bradyrhizobium septentrionale TaxID=1404411 RepID=UPI001F18CD4C|nr:hypothetical protein [Bradyrhizobium septentrionale]UGY22938.1 hypothetical protein HU675_0033945 [Bradyrhizobium septentrionale]
MKVSVDIGTRNILRQSEVRRRVEDVEFRERIEATCLAIMRSLHRATSGGGTLAERR